MDKNELKQAARLIADARQSGKRLTGFPDAWRPAGRAEGYAIQTEVAASTGEAGYGWKIAATSVAGQKHIGVSGPLAGRLLSGQVLDAGAIVSLAGNQMCLAECEFAFRMARDLPPRSLPYEQDEVLAAVASLHPAIELPDTRFVACEKMGEALLIADMACSHQFILGEAATADWCHVDLAGHQVFASLAGSTNASGARKFEGVGSNVLGDPRRALTWLVNELSGLGLGLRKAEVVTTGTCVAPIPVQAGETLRVDFGALGKVGASFCA